MPKERFPLTPITQAFEPRPPVPWVCERLGIAPGAPALVAGFGYSGKTVALQSMAVSVAGGLRIWDKFEAARGRVLHIDYEQGSRLTLDRYERLAHAQRLDVEHLVGQLDMCILPPGYLDDSTAEIELSRVCEGYTLCVVDSMRACAPGVDENSSEVRGVLDMLGRVSNRTQCAFVVIHHARKPSQGAKDAKFAVRGSGAIFDACASVLIFQGVKGEPTVISHEKARITGETCEELELHIEDTDDRAGLSVTATSTQAGGMSRSAERRFEALQRAVLEAIKRSPRIRSGALKQRVSGRDSAITAALEALADDGLVRNLSDTKRGAQWVAC